MLRPSYAELMDILSENSKEGVTSRYTVVIAAAKRARQIIDGDEPMVDADVNEEKPVSIAVEEMKESKISIVPEGQGTKLKPKYRNTEEEIHRELESREDDERAADEDNDSAAEEMTEETAEEMAESEEISDSEADDESAENATEE